MNSTPLVSICIPVYNTENFISETLECVLKQTYKNLEIIISDNYSTDRTVDIIKSYKDPRIKLFRNGTNTGLVNNFRTCLFYATGKYMMLLGADDGMELNAVERCVNVLEQPENKDVVLVNPGIKIIDRKGKTVYIKKFPFGKNRISSYWGIRSNFLWGSNIIGEPNGGLFRRDAFNRIPEPKFKNSNIWTIDLDLKFELMLHGDAFIIKEPLGKFRLSPQSTSSKELRFAQAKLFRQYALTIFEDKRYRLSYFWVMTASVNSILLQLARNVFYSLFIK